MSHISSFYKGLLAEIKGRVQKAQNRLSTIANTELIALYWDIGGLIVERQKHEGWGSGVLRRLAMDLKNELTDQQGFSERNLKLMTQFYREYPGLFAIGQQPVAQLADTTSRTNEKEKTSAVKGQQPVAEFYGLVRALSWTVNILLIQRVKDLEIRKWYMRACIKQGWGRNILVEMIKSNAHGRQGAAINNFDACLSSSLSKRAKETLKDPYIGERPDAA